MIPRPLSLLFAFALPLAALAAEPALSLALAPGQLEVVPSFEACSYYFRPVVTAGATYAVEFRRAGDERWRRAFDPVSDQPEGIWKGSIFDLAEDSVWQVRVLASAGAEAIPPVEFRTWSSHPPILKVVDLSKLPPSANGLVISEQGTPAGWIKYTAPRGWRLEQTSDGKNSPVAAITFRNARCVILEDVTIVGGQRNGVLIEESEAVRILNCDISGWGRVGVQQFTNTSTRGKYLDANGATINYDGGIVIHRSARTVVERCYVHDPRHRANSWMFSHPAGPTAMHVSSTRGGSVVRWNDFIGSDEHRWNDVIEASSNSAADGGFFRDSDISGNFLAFGNDDGVELEGGGMNVRFYRNKIEGTICGISTGATILGPQFVYGNLVANPGDESGLALMFFKNGHGAEQGGKRHFINNTLYGEGCSAYGGYGKAIGDGRIGFMRNNVFAGSDARPVGDWARRDDFDSDLFWVPGSAERARAFLGGFRSLGLERHGLAIDPLFASPAQGDFHLAARSPARGQAAAVNNLAEKGADLGAFADEAAEVPFRPLALVATPRQLEFSAPRRTARLEVTLSVPATAKESVPFEVRQNRVFTWFKVEPAAGEVAPGKSVTLAVTVDPAALRGRPRFRGAFLVRTPTGLSRPVSVYAAADFQENLRPAAASDAVYLEAATIPGLARFARATDDPAVFGGRYAALAGAATAPEIDVRIVLPRAGNYSLLARTSLGGDLRQRQSFALTLDEAADPSRFSLASAYQWNIGATNFRVVYLHALGELPAGEHRLRLRLLSGDLKLNELVVTRDPAAFFIDGWQRERN